VAASALPCRLFIYGTLLPGERDHAFLGSAELLGAVATQPLYQLVELNVYAALIPDGKVSVHGELYAVDLETRRRIDVARQVPILFQRTTVRLADGSEVETYGMDPDQVRGKRRLAHGDWRQRFTPAATGQRAAPGQLVSWARSRFDK
jgi:gamma-glutamylaminecyclotransferase